MKLHPCPHCKNEMILILNKHINIGLLLILLFIGIIPGIIYYVFAKASDNWICTQCTGDMIKDALNDKRKKNNGW